MWPRRLALLALVACGRLRFDPNANGDAGSGDGFVAASDAPVSGGARLRVRQWVTADGVSRFADFYDMQLQTACSFSADGSGTLRCFPDLAFVEAFTDSGCTMPAIRAGVGCAAAPPYATLLATTINGDVSTGYATGGALATAYVQGFTCQQASDGAAYLALGAAVPDATFVAASRNLVPLADGLSRVELVGEDGSARPVGYAYQGVDCTIQATSATTGACFPSATTIYSDAPTYADAACTSEIVDGIAMPAPPLVTLLRGDAPCRPLRVVQTGAQTMPLKAYYKSATGACTVFSPAVGTLYTAISDATAALPVLTYAVATTATRLRAITWTSPGGAHLDGRLYDTQLAAPCDPVTGFTGVTTCVPLGAVSPATTWTSANCNGPAPQAAFTCDGDDTSGSPFGGFGTPIKHDATCDGPSAALVTYTTKTTGIAYTKNQQNNCVVLDLTGATLYTTTQVAYDPSRAAVLTLQ